MLFIVCPDTTCVPHDLVFALDAIMLSRKYRVIPCNAIFAMPLDQVVGRKFPDFFSEETSSHIQSALERARDTKSRQEFQYQLHGCRRFSLLSRNVSRLRMTPSSRC
jgi:hypothetical protein